MKNKIKLLEIVGEPVGGIRKHIHSIFKNIDRSQFETYYIYSNSNTDKIFDLEINQLNIKEKNILKLKIHKKPHINDIYNIYILIKFMRKNSIQVIHGHGAKAGLYARIVKIFLPVKTVYTPHGGVLHNSFSAISTFIYIFIEKLLKPLTSLVIVESNYSRNKYIEKIGNINEKIFLNYNGVSSSHNNTSNITIPKILIHKKSNQIDLAIFARLHTMKGQNIAIKALTYLSDNFILHLFGDGERKETLQDLVSSLNLENRVYFHGDILYPEQMMQHIDIILIPSTFESFSYVAAEGLMMKKLVIANKVGGLEEVLAENCGILIENIDEFKLSNAIKNSLIQKEVTQEIITNGYHRYNNYFKEEEMVKNLLKYYKI